MTAYTTYATDDQILERDGRARLLLLDIDGGTTSGTFDRQRKVVYDRINAALLQREPPAIPVADDNVTIECEVWGVLAMAYREAVSRPKIEDPYWERATYYDARFQEALRSIRVDSDGDEDPGSIGESIPFYRS